MAQWRAERIAGESRWWLLSGTNTLGKINGERTAKLIVKEHNERQAPEPEPFNPQWCMSPHTTLAAEVKARGWTLRFIADLTDTSKSSVENYLTGKAPYPASWAVKFAHLLGVSPEFIWNLQSNYLIGLAQGKTDVTHD